MDSNTEFPRSMIYHKLKQIRYHAVYLTGIMTTTNILKLLFLLDHRVSGCRFNDKDLLSFSDTFIFLCRIFNLGNDSVMNL